MNITFKQGRRGSCFLAGGKPLTPLIILTIHIKPHKILFEEVKNVNSSRQIEFTGVPFVILGSKMMDCTHGIDHTLSRKRKKLEQKKAMKVTDCITVLLKWLGNEAILLRF